MLCDVPFEEKVEIFSCPYTNEVGGKFLERRSTKTFENGVTITRISNLFRVFESEDEHSKFESWREVDYARCVNDPETAWYILTIPNLPIANGTARFKDYSEERVISDAEDFMEKHGYNI